MSKTLKLKGVNKEAQAEAETPPAEKDPSDIDPAEDTAEDQTHVGDEGEWPVEEEGDKEPTLADDKKYGPVDPETGEPRICDGKAACITGRPSDHSPEEVGAAVIKGLDHLALCMTREVRTRQPELFLVFQLYAAERPSIIERQKRLQLRQNQG